MINFIFDNDIKSRVDYLASVNGLSHVSNYSIFCIRSKGSVSSRVQARCHQLPRIFQCALSVSPHYVIEVISERYDSLDPSLKDRLLLSILNSYIPKRATPAFKSGSINFYQDSGLAARASRIISSLGWSHIDPSRVYFFKSLGSKGRYVRARCWGLPRIWQQVLSKPACYIIEVMGEHYDKIGEADKDKLVIHELLHIPNKFKGGLRSHKGAGRFLVNASIVNKWYNKLASVEGLSWVKD